MAATSGYAFPYPELIDTADVPRDFQALANRIETVLSTGSITTTGTITGATIAGTAITASSVTATGTVSCASPTQSGHATNRGYIDARFRYGTLASRPSAGSVTEGTVYFGW